MRASASQAKARFEALSRECGGCLVWFGVTCGAWGDPWCPGHWRWTARNPLVVAKDLREYATHSDDLLGLEELRRRRWLKTTLETSVSESSPGA